MIFGSLYLDKEQEEKKYRNYLRLRRDGKDFYTEGIGVLVPKSKFRLPNLTLDLVCQSYNIDFNRLLRQYSGNFL